MLELRTLDPPHASTEYILTYHPVLNILALGGGATGGQHGVRVIVCRHGPNSAPAQQRYSANNVLENGEQFATRDKS